MIFNLHSRTRNDRTFLAFLRDKRITKENTITSGSGRFMARHISSSISISIGLYSKIVSNKRQKITPGFGREYREHTVRSVKVHPNALNKWQIQIDQHKNRTSNI